MLTIVNRKVVLPVLIALSFSLITFILCELVLRIYTPQMTYSKLLFLTGEQYVNGDFIPFTLKSNYEGGSLSQEFPGQLVTIRTNSLGLRGQETTLIKPHKTKRILILGDSYTFGVYCEINQIYPTILEKLYRQEGQNVEVINAGYADGWSPDEHYAWLVNRGINFEPDVIIYGFFIGNDISGILPSGWREIDKRGLPRRIINPDIYIDKHGRIRSKVKDEKTVGTDFIYKIPLLRESHFLILASRLLTKILHIQPNSSAVNQGWGETPFDPILKPSLSENNRGKDKLFLRLVKGMSEVANENHAKFLLLMIPVNFQVEPEIFLEMVLGSNKFKIERDFFKELEPVLKTMNIEYVNLLPRMKEIPERKFYPRNGEVHFNPRGHKFSATELKKKMDLLNWLSR